MFGRHSTGGGAQNECKSCAKLGLDVYQPCRPVWAITEAPPSVFHHMSFECMANASSVSGEEENYSLILATEWAVIMEQRLCIISMEFYQGLL